jgi:hypothetical protein
MRTRVLLGLTFVGVVVVVFLAGVLSRVSITEKDVTKVTEGMTRQEVESVLGGPADVQATWLSVTDTNKGITYRDVKLWHCRSESIAVAFDQEAIVRVVWLQKGYRPDTIFEMLKHWIGL